MSDFKTTPIKNSYELMIDRLKAVISDKDAEIARLKAENVLANKQLAEAQYQALQIAGERDALKAENERLRWRVMEYANKLAAKGHFIIAHELDQILGEP